jgi:tetratricopeptide (TPR) repeat protein
VSSNRRTPTPPPEPTNADEYVDRGNRYSRNGVYERAIADYTAAIEMDADCADAWFNRGISWYEVGEYAQSITDLTEAIRINPADDNYYSRRSLSHLFNDDPDAAQADMDESEAIRMRDWG